MKTTSPIAGTHCYEHLVLQNISEIIVITDLLFQVQSWNSAAERVYGIPAADAIGKRMKDLVTLTFHGTTLKDATDELQQKGLWQGKVSFTNAKGQTHYFLQTVKFIHDNQGAAVGIMALGHDITGKQMAEDSLAKSEQFYRALTADGLDLTMLLNASGEIIFTTPSIYRILGYTESDVLHTAAFGYIHPEDLNLTMESFEKEIEGTQEIKFIVVRIRKKSGEWLWCMARGHNLLNNPAINAVAVYIHDDTPRINATEALKESEKRFRTLIRDLQIGVLLQDTDGRIVMTNHQMCKLFDTTEEEILGGKIWDLYTNVVHEDGRQFLQKERPSYKAIQTKGLVKDVVMGVWHPKHRERIWIIINADPILDETGKVMHVVCSFTDITERKKSERKSFAEKTAHQRQLAQATIDGQERERLEMGKELHDNIGQQLTTVKLFLDMAKTTADPKTLGLVAQALRGITDVINEVRAISHSLVPPTLMDIGFVDSINELIESIQATQPFCIELDYFDFDEDQLPENKKLALYRIIQEQLNNIIKHANASRVVIMLRLTGSNVLLQIKDDGTGFDMKNIKRGMGITNIHNRAELFGGSMLLTTARGEGCQIDVCLPHSSHLVAFG